MRQGKSLLQAKFLTVRLLPDEGKGLSVFLLVGLDRGVGGPDSLSESRGCWQLARIRPAALKLCASAATVDSEAARGVCTAAIHRLLQ